MSFWPFGQNINNSNINKILDEYFSVLHSVESLLSKDNSINNNTAVQKTGSGGSSSNGDNDDADTNDNHLSTQKSGNISIQSPNGIDIKNNLKKKTSNNSSSSVSQTSGQSLIDDGTNNNNNNNSSITLSSLNSSFIDQILDEGELLNELTRKNNTLLDFICFGYFYDSNYNKIFNIEYLMNLLMICISNIDKYSEKTDNVDTITNKSSNDDDNNTNDDNIDNNDKHNDNDNNNDNEKDNNDDDDDDNNDNITITSEDKYLQKGTIISEVFALDIWLISESLVKSPVYLSNIWSILSNRSFNSSKSPLVAIFLKINTNLLLTRQDQYLNFIRSIDNNINSGDGTDSHTSGKNLVDDMLQHINCPVLMDFFLKIISTDKIDNPTGILQLIYEQKIILKLLKFFQNDKYSMDLQTSSCDFLKALIAISANAPLDELTIGPNILTRQLCMDQEVLDLFIEIITKEKKYALNHTVSIVIELIRKNNSDYDQINLLQTTIKGNPPSQRDPIYLGYMLKKFAQHLKEIVGILYTENTNEKSINQMGESFEPLGSEKFKVVELIAELLHCSNMGLLNSRRAELIAKKRDSLRCNLSKQLEDALQDLNIDDDADSTISPQLSLSDSPSPCYPISLPSETETRTDSSGSNASFAELHDQSPFRIPTSEDNTPSPPQTSDLQDPFLQPQLSKDSSNQDLPTNNDDDLISNIDFYDKEEEEIFQTKETDEFFDIPYVNEKQNVKLRTESTIGDFFKIQLFDLQILPHIVTLFLKYPWNNFWHNVIFDILQQLFNGRMDYSYNSFLVYSLFANSTIDQYTTIAESDKIEFDAPKDLILKGYKESGEYYHKNNINLGYMGHLVLIAEEIVKFSKVYKVDLISPEIHESLINPKWVYYSEDILMDTRLMYSKILGGDMIATNGSSEEDLLFEQKLQEQQQQQQASKHTDDFLDTSDSDADDAGLESGSLLKPIVDEEFIHYTTQGELHKKLREKLIEKSEEEVRLRNEESGVIVLGYAPTSDDVDAESPLAEQ